MTMMDRLLRRHAGIEAQIAREQARPGADWTRVSALKKAKLRIKDMLARLQQQMQQRLSGQR